MVTVKEILFPELNGESREISKVKVIIQAHDVLYREKTGGSTSAYLDKNSRQAQAINSSFRLVVDNLPTQRTLRISNLRIVPSSQSTPLCLSIDVASQDAQQWNDWFRTAAGSGLKKEASITLLDQTMSQNIFSLQLSELEIVSVSAWSIPGGVPKTTVGLRTRNIPTIQ
jgi:hypothetical protein